MGSEAILRLDVASVISKVREILGVELPSKIIEVTLLPEDSLLYIRFKEPQGLETGEPVHPLIHMFRDEREEITAIEIIDVEKFLREPISALNAHGEKSC